MMKPRHAHAGGLDARSLVRVITSVWLAASTPPALAWVYPEHRDIAVLAVQELDPQHQAQFDEMWQVARSGQEARLCVQAAVLGQGVAPECIDWAVLPAIAGDHSCSSRQMLDTVVSSQWILVVADVAAQLKVDLAQARDNKALQPSAGMPTMVANVSRHLDDAHERAEIVNALRTANIRMLRADPAYATRADANNAHFLQARPTTDLDPDEYVGQTLAAGSEISALGVYTWYHTSAIEKASRLSGTQLTPEQRQELTRSALFDEAFALHFLEDVYAAGHVAGSWGDASQRMGTHDYYNEHGLEVFMWDGRKSTVVLMGDAHMRAQDAELTANAVRSSLTQVLDAAAGQAPSTAPARPSEVPLSADDFNVCKTNAMPARTVDDGGGRYRPAVDEIVAHTPVPGLTPGLGARPRFREEIGPFVGFAGGIDGRVVNNGYDKEKTTHGYLGGVDVALRLGLGLDGVLDESGDGLIFAQAGYRFTSASTNKFIHYSGAGFNGDLTSAIPAERGLALRFRMPFYLIPGDLLLLSPLYFLNRDAYAQMAVTAANGGLIPWQLGLATRFGRFQFVLGRELGVTLYGLDGNQQLLNFTREGQLQIVNYKSIGYDLPVLEYRPYRQFSTDQSSSILFQLFIGLEVPYGVSVDSPPRRAAGTSR